MIDATPPRADALAQAAFEATQLLSRFYGALDERDYDAVADCFAPDGQWHRLGQSMRGPEEVRGVLRKRSPKLVTHHLVSNCLFDAIGPDRLKARYLLTVFQTEQEAAPGQPRVAPAPRVGFSDVEVVRSAGGWRLASMQIRTPTFVAGPG